VNASAKAAAEMDVFFIRASQSRDIAHHQEAAEFQNICGSDDDLSIIWLDVSCRPIARSTKKRPILPCRRLIHFFCCAVATLALMSCNSS
jgi:hypothetical protein